MTEQNGNGCNIHSKEDLYCHVLPLIKGVEEQGEDTSQAKYQAAIMGAMLETGDMSPDEACNIIKDTFGDEALDKAGKICKTEREEIEKDYDELDDVVNCSSCSVVEEEENQ